MKDLVFLSGSFFDYDLPKDRQFLFRYFRTPIEKQFVRYYFCFEEYVNFVDHTGFYCQLRWLRILHKRLVRLVEAYKKAKQDMDFETLGQLQAGKYKE